MTGVFDIIKMKKKKEKVEIYCRGKLCLRKLAEPPTNESIQCVTQMEEFYFSSPLNNAI